MNGAPRSESSPPEQEALPWSHPRRIHLLVARALVIAVFGQIGLGVVALPIHQVFGILIGALSVMLAVSAVRGGFSRSTRGLSVAFLALTGLQGVFIALSDSVPLFTAFHLFNGFLLFAIAIVVAIESEDEGRAA
jgi:hypothetical protein